MNGFITNFANPGLKNFYDIKVPGDKLIAIFVTSDEDSEVDPLDTTLSLIRRPSEVIIFNDDVSSDNKNAMIFYFSPIEEDLVVEVNNLKGQGNFKLEAQIVEQDIEPEIILVKNIVLGELFLSTLVLEKGKTYEIFGITFANLISFSL